MLLYETTKEKQIVSEKIYCFYLLNLCKIRPQPHNLMNQTIQTLFILSDVCGEEMALYLTALIQNLNLKLACDIAWTTVM